MKPLLSDARPLGENVFSAMPSLPEFTERVQVLVERVDRVIARRQTLDRIKELEELAGEERLVQEEQGGEKQQATRN
jgi:hypothetical protein